MPESGWLTDGYWLSGMAAALLTVVLVAGLRIYALRTRLVAEPGKRSSHVRPTPTGGGAGLVAAWLVVGYWPLTGAAMPDWWWGAGAPSVVVLAITGWIDDRRDLAASIRLAVQLAVSLGLLMYWRVQNPGGEGTTAGLHWGLWIFALCALVWIMNAWNFMDGSDGLAAGQGAFSAVALAWLFGSAGDASAASLAAILAGSCLGFLAWNRPTASIFMGDTGSVPLGFVMAALLVTGMANGAVPPPVALLVIAPFMVDAGLTLVVRVMRGERWYTAHRSHLYQRLIAQGWSHGRVWLLYMGVNVVILAPAIEITIMYPDFAWPMSGICVALLSGVWLWAMRRVGSVRKHA